MLTTGPSIQIPSITVCPERFIFGIVVVRAVFNQMQFGCTFDEELEETPSDFEYDDWVDYVS